VSELIDRIPGQESVVAKLRGIVDTTLQLKARQRTTGRGGQLGYAIDSANAWDFDGSVAYTNSTYQIAEFHIIFTGDGTQKYPIAVPQFDVRINGTDASNRMVFRSDTTQYEYQDAAVEVMAFEYGEPVNAYFASETQSAWSLKLFFIGKTGSGNFALRIKPRAQASCGGVFTVVRVA